LLLGFGPKVDNNYALNEGVRENGGMHVSAKVDYGMRALLALAASRDSTARLKGEVIASTQHIPFKFLEGILAQLRTAGMISSQRGPDGGYRLDRDPDEITVADVIRALEGPLADVRGERPELLHYSGPAEHLQEVWIAVRAALRGVVENVTLADVASGNLPPAVTDLLVVPGAWQRR
jgi:Rrf2 family protein